MRIFKKKPYENCIVEGGKGGIKLKKPMLLLFVSLQISWNSGIHFNRFWITAITWVLYLHFKNGKIVKLPFRVQEQNNGRWCQNIAKISSLFSLTLFILKMTGYVTYLWMFIFSCISGKQHWCQHEKSLNSYGRYSWGCHNSHISELSWVE